jgi:hypothetical protein
MIAAIQHKEREADTRQASKKTGDFENHAATPQNRRQIKLAQGWLTN